MDKITEVLTRGVEKIYPSQDELEKVLRSGKKLRLYQGFDPTGTQLHIGHAVALQKLRQFQQLDHEVIFLIGDGTGQAGDPSGKLKARDKFFTREELRRNALDYVKQAGKIVSFEGTNPVKILYNGDWLNKLTLVEILDLLQNFSVQQLLERDMYQERMRQKETINMREIIYPALQGYDSVAMEVDLEIGGTDQTFNMLCGRQLVKTYLNKEKFVMTAPLITDAQGQKIGKSQGNVIALVDKPENTFGMIMSLADETILPIFECCTDLAWDEVKKIGENLAKKNDNPMVYKKQLAREIVKMLHDENTADVAQKEFEKVVQKGGVPNSVEVIEWTSPVFPISLIDLAGEIQKHNAQLSNSELKRLARQEGILYGQEKIIDPTAKVINPGNGIILRIGKRHFFEIKKS